MAKPLDILTGKRGFIPSKPADLIMDAEIVGGSGLKYSINTLGPSPKSLGKAANGTTATFKNGDLVTVLYPGGDKSQGRVIARVPGRRREPKTFIV